MTRKVVGYLSILICLIWIAFVGSEILQKNKESDFLCYFGPQDSTILAIHQLSEFSWDSGDFSTLGSNKDLFYELIRNIQGDYSAFISKERRIIILESSQSWNTSSTRYLFNKSQRNFEMTGLKSFKYGTYVGSFSGKQLIIYPKELNLEPITNTPFKVDKQASYSLISFEKNNVVTKDLYVKDDCKIIYETKRSENDNPKLVDDRAIYAENLPDNFSSYIFYEKSYLMQKDQVFRGSLFHNYMQNGLVELDFNGQKVLIFDLMEGQSLIQNLNETLKKEEDNLAFGYFQGISVKEGLGDTKTLGVYITEVNGFAYLSTDKEAVDKVLTEIQMNHTLSSNEKQFNALHSQLPVLVSMRTVNKSSQETISHIGKNAIKTNIYYLNNSSDINENETKDYFSMNPGNRIVWFCALAGRGNAIVFTENQELHGYKNGTKIWGRKTSQPLLANPSILSYSQNERESIALRFSDHIEVVDKSGRIIQSIQNKATLAPIRYLVKDKFQLLCAGQKSVIAYSEQGKVSVNLNATNDIKQISVYYEGLKPFCAILTNSDVQLIDLTNKRSVRKINLPNSEFSQLVESGGVVIKEKNSYYCIDNRGNKTKLNTDQSWQLSSCFINNNVSYLLFSKQNQCSLLKNDGAVMWSKSFELRDISAIQFSKINDKPILTLFDGLENNIYLCDFNGLLLDKINRPANCPAQTTAFGITGQSITTLLGNILIQYTKY